jgi:two-component system cell cycle sensor histidine kinase/response regulator CckA
MPFPAKKAFYIPAAYAGLGVLWNFGLDRYLHATTLDPPLIRALLIVSACAYVAAGALLLWMLQRRGAQRVRRAEDQAWQAQKAEGLGRMAASIAHDLNNVLQVIISSADLDAESGGGTQASALRIRDTGRKGQALVRQLMDFVREHAGPPEPVDAAGIVLGSEHFLRRMVRPPVKLEMRAEPGAGLIRANPVHMEQVLMNMVVNAADAMPGGGTVSVEVRGNGPWAEICVRDAGCGIPPQVLPRIFEPYFTTKGGKGTGLGLATVDGIVRRMGGRIEVHSRPGEGTTFRVFIPVEGAAAGR